MKRVLPAELAKFLHLKPVRIVFLVLDRVIVSLLAFSANQRDLYSNSNGTSIIVTSLGADARPLAAARKSEPQKRAQKENPAQR